MSLVWPAVARCEGDDCMAMLTLPVDEFKQAITPLQDAGWWVWVTTSRNSATFHTRCSAHPPQVTALDEGAK